MADVDEDTLTNPSSQIDDDNEPGDETADFLLLSSLNSKSGQLPKRGEKDFEGHGTKHQHDKLSASRQAMHDVLSYKRTHNPKTHIRGFYYGGPEFERDKVITKEWRQGLEDDHVVVVESPKGPNFRAMGKSTEGKAFSSLWLLPEEALYLVERGSLDLYWPNRSSYTGMQGSMEDVKADRTDEEEEATPMSLQAAYAMLIGDDSERGKVGLNRYQVFANLRRMGYIVRRSHAGSQSLSLTSGHIQGVSPKSGILDWLMRRLYTADESSPPPYGPLVKPGMYRSYNSIYRQIAVIPRHTPQPAPSETTEAEFPYRVVYELWKATRTPTFAKSNPGSPDFRLAIADSRSTFVPTLKQMTSLLESTPWDPPPAQLKPHQVYQRLRHGHRNVVLAVNDRGMISYLRLGEAAFGEETVYERFDGYGRSSPGSKRGGGPSRGRGGGRGRGRGRGTGRGGK